MKEQLKKLEGHLVKVLYQDGDRVACTRGKLVSVDEDSLALDTLSNRLIISLSLVKTIKAPLNDQGGSQ